MSGVRHIAFPDRSPMLRDAAEVSRFSCMLFLMFVSKRAGVSDYSGPGFRSRLSLPPMLPSCHSQGGRRPSFRSSKLNRPAHQCLWLRFAHPGGNIGTAARLCRSDPVRGRTNSQEGRGSQEDLGQRSVAGSRFGETGGTAKQPRTERQSLSAQRSGEAAEQHNSLTLDPGDERWSKML